MSAILDRHWALSLYLTCRPYLSVWVKALYVRATRKRFYTNEN